MKTCLLLILSLALVTPASPLVFKTIKAIDSPNGFSELAVVDTSKYRQARVQVVNVDERIKSRSDYSSFEISLMASELHEIDTELVEDKAFIRFSSVIECPPSTLAIKVKGRGTFRVYIWAQ